ncbi:Uncharacterised protein [Klebsiella pneumoniae]|nr:Uncharacterised protein [Klebsiella pneumoniae]
MAKTKSVRPPFVVGGVDTHKDLHPRSFLIDTHCHT